MSGALFAFDGPTVANIRITPDVQAAPNYRYAGRPRSGVDPAGVKPGTEGWLGNPFNARDYPDAIAKHARYLEQRLLEPEFAAAFDALPADVIFGCFCVDRRGAGACHAKTLAKVKRQRTGR